MQPYQKAILLSLSAFTYVGLTPLPALAIEALDNWDNAARQSLSVPVKVWLGMMLLTNVSAIGFMKSNIAARWVFAGFLLSHLTGGVLLATGATLLAGQVSLLHIIFWTPGMIMLFRYRREIRPPAAYGIWALLSLMFYFGSMMFDLPDALTYVKYSMQLG